MAAMTYSRMIVPLFVAAVALPAQAERVLREASVEIHGETRRYYHLHDTGAQGKVAPILLISGSGCGDFGARFAGFFETYPATLDLYFLEKPHIEKGASGQPGTCSAAYKHADTLERRVADTLEFIGKQPALKALPGRSLALIGFSEGGMIAPIVAARSKTAGWLVIAGAGGMKQSEEFLVFADRGVAPYATVYSRAKLEAEFSAIRSAPDAQDKEFFGLPYRYWSSHLFHDPLPVLAQLDIPIVAAMGEKDDSVPIESGRLLQSYFARHPEKNFQFIEYKDANHRLQANEKSHLKPFLASLAKWFEGDKAKIRSLE